ncbi:hypothetical protein SCHPADRAFT_1001651 [Schizopora paradoxa]|uniref:Serine/threonine-protein kinase Tel1 n=1 Tax=Schizopora paradoxa TaxID=27342 RepID=A0A0H2RD80_9AGAM|nr:hypothetical protein SCHPADRAFT_1001651 [Schizopora paradoxa]
MGSQVTLKQVLTLLKSDKSKDRQQGINSLKDAFGRREAIQKLDAEKKDGRAWLIVFQALFSTVLSERTAALKKGSLSSAAPATLRRLEDAAGAVRWLVERSVAEWNGKVCKPLIKHLMQCIVHQGKLLPPVALHYVKALRIICAYPPHLDHIQYDEAQCISILSLAFAAVLGDSLKSNLEDEEEGMSENEVMDELSEGTESGSSRKRKRSPERGRSCATQKPRSVSLEQIEFVAIISIILRSPRTQLVHPDHPHLPRALLDRLCRFFKLYSSDTSAHLDMMSAVNSALDALALNCKNAVADFGKEIWDSLLSLWSTKSRDLKESVLAALTTLLPHVAHPDVNFDIQDGVGRLLRLLHGENDARWGFEALSIDSVRLEIVANVVRGEKPFSARTFTHGFGFNASEVVAWTVMELQADCMKELYMLSESIHPGTPSVSRSEGKRARLINPVSSLLQSVQKHQSAASRSFYLQCLLFFIDRHWSLLHSDLRLEVANTLLQVVAIDDPTSQSWVFACFAALSYAEGEAQSTSETAIIDLSSTLQGNPSIPWDTIWSHAMRRTSSPAIGRAACHAAHTLLICERLPSNRVLTEIEAMIQDISVQGPTAPFDSVCAFLSGCLKVASQDARLYRMHMEDKVLSWLSENMNSLGGHLGTAQNSSSNAANVSRLEQYNVQDVLGLLQTACSLSQRSYLVCPLSLPDHFLVPLQKDRSNASIIRGFLLHASLTHDDRSRNGPLHDDGPAGLTSASETKPSNHSSHLVSPGIRERKASALLLKLVESVTRDWESRGTSRPTVESVRRVLDFAVLAISFEGLLVLNGMTINRRSILVACKLIATLVQCLVEMHWTYDEMALLCEAFLPLTNGDDEMTFDDTWEGVVDAGPASGISATVSTVQPGSHVQQATRMSRKQLQGIIWQSADVQDTLESSMKVFRKILSSVVSGRPLRPTNQLTSAGSMVADDEKDDFAPIRTAQTTGAIAIPGEEIRVDRRLQDVARICVDVLTMIPILQSSEQRAPRDKSLAELFCDSIENETFSVLMEPFICHVFMRNIHIGSSVLDRLFGHVGDLLVTYKFGQSEPVQMMAILLLHATASIWLDAQSADEDIITKAQVFYRWAIDVINKSQLRSWRTRNKMVHFLEHFLSMDPHETFLSNSESKEFDVEEFPSRLLPLFNKDCDMRVRFTAACASARLFSTPYMLGKDPMIVYGYIRDQLCVVLANYEEMLTRMLCLGNVMVTSSSVRRGPLWHSLETCLFTQTYIPPVSSILREVARKLGLRSVSPLFEAYASQIVFSLRRGNHDIFRLPPALLGYDSRKAFAEATFMSFSPTNLLQDENGDIEGGKAQFKRHCNIVGLSEEDGLRICFADVVGYHITAHFTFKPEKVHPPRDEVKMEEDSIDIDTREEIDEDDIILHLLVNLYTGIDVPTSMKDCVDSIVLSIVRTLSDFDFREDGLIVRALEEEREFSDKVSRAFRSLMRFRNQFEFDVHDPNLPTCATHLVLKSLKWLSDRIDTVKSAGAVYHVVQTLFTEVARCPVVNEQIRLMTSLCVYISVNRAYFRNVALLRVLLNGSASLLSNPILVGFAQGILDWTFLHLRDLNCEAPHLSAILIRIGCAARDFCRATNESVRLKGTQLKAWIEGQLKLLSDVSSLRFCVLSALAAWPDQLPTELEDLRTDLTPTDLSAILDDPFLPTYNFKVVRHILEIGNGSSYSTEQFSKRDFWRLKDSVPSSALVDDEAVAFSRLLVHNRGHIESHTVDQQYKRSIGARHQRYTRDDEKNKKSNRSTVKLPIVMAFLDLLADEDPSVMSVAYQTLRRIASTNSLDSKAEFGSWPSEYRGDASLLSFCPIHRKEKLTASLCDIETEEFIALGRDFLQWIAKITKFLAGLLSGRDQFFSHLRHALETNISFAEQIFPVLVHEVLRIDYEGKESVARAVSHRTILSKYFASLLTSEKTDPRCLLCLVNTVLHLRNFEPTQSPDLLIYNKWLDLDFVLLSRCAIACGAYTTGLLFLELATDGRANESAEIASEEILFDIYSHIEEPDGFYGIKSRDPRSFLLKRFRHERQWNKSFQFHGARFEAGEIYAGNNQGIVESLQSFGFNKLALSCLESSGFDGMASGSASAMTYRLGWRAESWDLPDLPTCDNSSSTLYSALKVVHRDQDSSSVDKVVNAAIWKELQRLRDLANENLVEIRQVTQAVMCLAQIKEWRSDAFQSDILSRCIDPTSGHWMSFSDIAPGFGFDDLESILATRISLLRSTRQREQRDQIGTMLSDMSQSLLELEIKCLVQLSEAAREEGETQIALNSITQAQLLDQGELFEISDEFASVLWGQGEQRLAVELLKKELRLRAQVSSPKEIDDRVRHACILARLGEWTSEACLEKPESILETYFKPAIKMMEDPIAPSTSQSSSEDRSAVYYKFALFAEQQYQALLRSDEIARFKVYSERKKQEVSSRQASLKQAHSSLKENQLDKAMKLWKQDTAYYQHATQSRDLFLAQAIEMLSHALCASDTFDGDASIRLCSLWLSNFKTTTLDKTIKTSLERVPSRKLVFLAHQLSARLTDSNDASVNQLALRALVLRMGSEHPFHSLYQVYALQSSDTASRRTSTTISETFSQRERANAASNIFDRLLSAPGPSSRVRDLQKLCEAYIEWANFPVKKNPLYSESKKPFKVPAHMKIRKISNLPIPVTTYHTPLDPTMRYDNLVWIEGYADQFDLAGGVHFPKISLCKGSDGNTYKQLFKSEDDLRQDAVMEQVFELCNQVLRRSRNSRKRNLSIRSYKVVPLAAQAGLLEFVGNTTPMKDWLLTAHKRYNRKDLGLYECQQMLKTAVNNGKSGLIKAMKDIRAHFHPVLRHFFTERHKLPLAWFEMRLNYTRSVATTSIIGHILGLGDRHISNILLDKVSGEVVHIDLGIAFDQGKLLPVPEIVPFRLTPDVVDGFGISGTEGVFRRCAEETLRVLREGSAVIKTVLEVFKYDPLHSWTANALRLQKAQGGSSMINLESERFGIGIDMESGSEDENADRALSGVVRKLDKSLSVEFTVNELISEATDDTNLAQMFHGWSPQC